MSYDFNACEQKALSLCSTVCTVVEQPGHNVRQKAGLNKSILDQGWGMLKQMLGYKLPCAGGFWWTRPTPRKSVRFAVWWMRRIARRKPCFTVSTVGMKPMPT